MAFWDDAKQKVLQAMKPRQQDEHQVLSNRADGGFSGYVPKMNRPQTEPNPTGYQQPRPAGFENMVPSGVDPSVMQQFQPVGGQTGAMAPAGQAFPQGMPRQDQMQPRQAPFGQPGYQQPMQANPQMPPRPQAQFQGQNGGVPQQMGPAQPGQAFQQNMPQATRPGFGQPAFQQNAAPQQPLRGFSTQQPPVQPQAAPVQTEPQTFAFPGGDSYMVDGHAYKLIFRVAQITGVPSCFRVIEFMYNNEAVIVNAEQITDLVEANRCMDLIFGAACAMKQRLMRVSGKQIYLITPPQVYVAPFDNLRRAGMEDIERRWPGAMQANMQPQAVVNNIQQLPNAQPMLSVNQPAAAAQPMGFQPDFAGGMGRRVARSQGMNVSGYTDYGGFGVKSR